MNSKDITKLIKTWQERASLLDKEASFYPKNSNARINSDLSTAILKQCADELEWSLKHL